MKNSPESPKFQLFSPILAKILFFPFAFLCGFVVSLVGFVIFSISFQYFTDPGNNIFTLMHAIYLELSAHFLSSLIDLILTCIVIINSFITIFALWRNTFNSKLHQQSIIIFLSFSFGCFFNELSKIYESSHPQCIGVECRAGYYEILPQWGWPFPYAEMSQSSSVSTFVDFRYYILNLAFYFILVYLLLFIHSQYIQRKNSQKIIKQIYLKSYMKKW